MFDSSSYISNQLDIDAGEVTASNCVYSTDRQNSSASHIPIMDEGCLEMSTNLPRNLGISLEAIMALGALLLSGEPDDQKAARLIDEIGRELHGITKADHARLAQKELARRWPKKWSGRHSRIRTLSQLGTANVPAHELRDLALTAQALKQKRIDQEHTARRNEAKKLEAWARQKEEGLRHVKPQ